MMLVDIAKAFRHKKKYLEQCARREARLGEYENAARYKAQAEAYEQQYWQSVLVGHEKAREKFRGKL
jgi:hypothetical protein